MSLFSLFTYVYNKTQQVSSALIRRIIYKFTLRWKLNTEKYHWKSLYICDIFISNKNFQEQNFVRNIQCIPEQVYIYRHAKKPIHAEGHYDKCGLNKGSPRKLTKRDHRALLREIPKFRNSFGAFTAKRLRLAASIRSDMHDETVRRLFRGQGYKYSHSRKKDLSTVKDLAQRLKFCRSVKWTTDENFWRTYIGFYLDGVAFQHKYNPHNEEKSCRTMAWRRKDEGLETSCTAKGSLVGSGGNVAHFMVGISYDKGIILCKQYFGLINGEKFSRFIFDNFEFP